jgi:hypothetical protein
MVDASLVYQMHPGSARYKEQDCRGTHGISSNRRSSFIGKVFLETRDSVAGMALAPLLFIYFFTARAASATRDHTHHGRAGHHPDLHHHDEVAWYALLAFGGLATLVFAWTTYFRLTRHLRRVLCLTAKQQSYFARPHHLLAKLRVHLLDAPLFSRRHNTELRLSRAVNVRTLPTRFQTLLILALLIMNVVLCVVAIPFDNTREGSLGRRMRHRFGVMAVANLVPLVLWSGRNNPLILLLGIPYDTFNLLHRWLGRIVVLEALGHVLAYCIPKAAEGIYPSYPHSISAHWQGGC